MAQEEASLVPDGAFASVWMQCKYNAEDVEQSLTQV
jgi:hypothetical protein